jgi:hypothetical protein
MLQGDIATLRRRGERAEGGAAVTNEQPLFDRLSASIRSWDHTRRAITLGGVAWFFVSLGSYVSGSGRSEMMGAGFGAYIGVVAAYGVVVLASRTFRRSNTGRPRALVSLNWLPLTVSVVMLIMAAAGGWPRGFYDLLRIVISVTGVYVLIQTLNVRKYWPWIAGGIAALFNPILPVSFTTEQWQPIDIVVAAVFMFALVRLRPPVGR